MKRLRIGVFMGGKSHENEASFNSGRTVCDHLDNTQYDIIPIFQTKSGNLYKLPWKFLHRGKTSDFEHRLNKEATLLTWDQLKNLVDFVYIAAHGQFAEDGTLQGTLEVLNIPYLGSKIYSSSVCIDKRTYKTVLSQYNILTPKGTSITPHQWSIYKNNKNKIEKLLNDSNLLDSDLIIKPALSGSSLGINFVQSIKQNHKFIKDISKSIDEAMYLEEYKAQPVIIEKAITGLEFTCIVITDYKTGEYIALPPTEIVPETNIFDYTQKYMPGRATKFTPARCSENILNSIKKTCINTIKALEIENIGRIDGFVTKDNKVIITDANTLAGMSPSSFIFRQAAEIGMSHTDFINHLIKTELHKYNMVKNINKNQKLSIEEKKRVAVLFGGNSNEKEISLESGRNVIYKLSPEKYTPIPLFIDKNLNIYHINQKLLVRNSTKEIEQDLNQDMHIQWSELPKIADFVFIALHGGAGENGSVQGILEMLQLPYNGSPVQTSSLCIDKYKTNNFLSHHGFNVPKSMLIKKVEWNKFQNSIINDITTTFKLPVIIKPHDDGCSYLVKKIYSKHELIKSFNDFFNGNSFNKEYLLVEEFLCNKDTIELTVGIIGNNKPYALPPSRSIAQQDILSIEEKFLPGAGENQTPAPLDSIETKAIQNTLVQAYKTLNCKGYARIDCFYNMKTKKLIILEVNTLPALTPATCIFHQAAELSIKPMEFIDTIIELGLEEHNHCIQQKHKIDKSSRGVYKERQVSNT